MGCYQQPMQTHNSQHRWWLDARKAENKRQNATAVSKHGQKHPKELWQQRTHASSM